MPNEEKREPAPTGRFRILDREPSQIIYADLIGSGPMPFRNSHQSFAPSVLYVEHEGELLMIVIPREEVPQQLAGAAWWIVREAEHASAAGKPVGEGAQPLRSQGPHHDPHPGG